jgi:hypothetical protein
VYFTTAFVMQTAYGWIVTYWPMVSAVAYPPVAYKAAFAIFIALQIIAFAWMALKNYQGIRTNHAVLAS